MTPEELRDWVTASRAKQGLPPTVEDPGVLERAAAAFRVIAPADQPAPPKPRKRRKPSGARADLGGRPAA